MKFKLPKKIIINTLAQEVDRVPSDLSQLDVQVRPFSKAKLTPFQLYPFKNQILL